MIGWLGVLSVAMLLVKHHPLRRPIATSIVIDYLLRTDIPTFAFLEVVAILSHACNFGNESKHLTLVSNFGPVV